MDCQKNRHTELLFGRRFCLSSKRLKPVKKFNKANCDFMKTRLLCVFALHLFAWIIPSPAKAQTDYQFSLVNDFIRTEGGTAISTLAHPLYSAFGYELDHSGHTYYITLKYRNGDRSFSCHYTLYLSSVGEVQSLSATDCNSPFSLLFQCFDFSDAVKNQISEWASDENNYKLVRLIGKSLSEFTAKDVCLARLYLLWHRDYYSRY